MLVAIVGPDGCGKSTVTQRLTEVLSSDFKAIYRFHWRPGTIPRLRDLLGYKGDDPPPSAPHAAPMPGRFSSLVRFLYYALDFTLGARIGSFKAAQNPDILVLVERYYHDLLVDPLRYRIGVPEKVVRVLRPLVPKPDLIVFLDGDPEVFFRRKPELPLDELNRQIRVHRRTVYEWARHVQVVDATAPLDRVIAQVSDSIRNLRKQTGQALANQRLFHLRALLADPLPDSGSGNGYLLIPDRTSKVRRWVLPERASHAALKSLYRPYSTPGRLLLKAFPLLLRAETLRLIRFPRLHLSPRALRSFIRWLQETAHIEGVTHVAFNTGTPGPEGKLSGVALDQQGRPLAYFKAAKHGFPLQLLRNESLWLKRLAGSPNLSVEIPRLLGTGTYQGFFVEILSPVGLNGKAPSPKRLPRSMEDMLSSLASRFGHRTAWKEGCATRKVIERVRRQAPLLWRWAAGKALQELDRMLTEVRVSLVHGDLAPWNVRVGRETAVLDWERAAQDELMGMDLCHFFVAPRAFAGEKPADLVQGCMDFLKQHLDLLGAPPRAVLMAYLCRFGGELAGAGLDDPWTRTCFRMLEEMLP